MAFTCGPLLKAFANDDNNITVWTKVQSEYIRLKGKSECPSSKPTAQFDFIYKELGVKLGQHRQQAKVTKKLNRSTARRILLL